MKISEISARSPDMTEDDFTALVDDIRKNGQLVPIWVRGDEVIDGRKRLRVCELLSIEPKVVNLAPGQEAEALARSLNLLRTHYSPSQRAMFAAERATRSRQMHDDPIGKNTDQPPSARQAANEVGIAESYVTKARRLKRDAAPEVVAAVKAGKLTLHAARQIAETVPKTEQSAAVEKVIAASKGKMRHTPAKVALGKRLSQAGMSVRKAPPLTHQWNEFLNQAEFAADNMEATMDRVTVFAEAPKWLERARGIRTTLTKIIHCLGGTQ